MSVYITIPEMRVCRHNDILTVFKAPMNISHPSHKQLMVNAITSVSVRVAPRRRLKTVFISIKIDHRHLMKPSFSKRNHRQMKVSVSCDYRSHSLGCPN